MKRFSKGLGLIIVATLLMAVVALPARYKTGFPDVPVLSWAKNQQITLGLDLQGGTQLDYRIDLRSVDEKNNDDDPDNDVIAQDIVNGVLNTIEERVNGLGVSEANIYVENFGDEKHIMVELPGIKDIEEAKATVGKTIQLEFKELGNGDNTEQVAAVQTEADLTLQEALSEPENFVAIAEASVTNDGKIVFEPNQEGFASELSGNLAAIGELEVGEVYPELIQESGNFVVSSDGQITQRQGLLIVQLDDKETRENTIQIQEQVEASHILIAYEGADGATEEITRSEEEALEEAERILSEPQEDPDAFNELAVEFSDDPTGQANEGNLDFFTRGEMVEEFEAAAFEMEIGDISEVVESPFGYHIIKVTDRIEEGEEVVDEDYVTYSQIFYDTSADPWVSTGLDGSKFNYASTSYDPYTGAPVVNIQFDNEGALMFEELTERLIDSQLAIFVGGELISAPAINEKIIGGGATISGGNPPFTLQSAINLANDLNTGAIDAPIILSGQYTISASLGADALSLSIYAGLIGLIALAIFMVLYYRLMGFFAVMALGVYSVIILFVLKTTGIVMTLAGIAGIILSIGMAVDANILIFERSKEELRNGASYNAAIITGFERAWSSIRDSNVSSLITCVILFGFGNSIIKGFALMLGIGILVSMFTAIYVTRALLHTLSGTKVSKNRFLLGGGVKKN